ncbi:MAG: CPBP family intramembrane metalloprotease [Eubacterium sp.]|nr:CPBP family intramembrane metalloprotease [Eubacterium sp.]
MSEKAIFNRLGLAMFVYLVLWVGLQLVLATLIPVVAPNALEQEWLYWLVVMGPMYFVALPVAVKLLKKLPTRKLYEHKLHKGHFVQIYLMTVALMLIGNIIGIIITTILTNVTGVDFAVSITESIFEYKLIWVLLITVIIAPIVEEFLFRKVLIDRLIVFGDGVAIVVSALMFGLTHGNLTQLFYTTLIGLMFGFVYVRTGKLKYSVGLHMLFNFLGGFVPAAFMKRMDIFEMQESLLYGDFSVVFERIGSLLGFVGYEMAIWGCGIAGFVLLIINRKKFLLYQGELPLSRGEVAKQFFTTPCMWLWIIATVALFVINVVGI